MLHPTMGQDAALTRRKAVLNQEIKEAGRQAASLTTGSPSFKEGEIRNEPRRVGPRIRDAGCEYNITPWFPKEDYKRTVQRFASELMPFYPKA